MATDETVSNPRDKNASNENAKKYITQNGLEKLLVWSVASACTVLHVERGRRKEEEKKRKSKEGKMNLFFFVSAATVGN